MSTSVSIVPVPVVKTVVRAQIELTSLELGSRATFTVNSWAESGLVKCDVVLMEGNAYAQWQNNDQYAITYCLTQLGYVELPGA